MVLIFPYPCPTIKSFWAFEKTHWELAFDPKVRPRNQLVICFGFFFFMLMTQSGKYTGLTPLIFWKAESSFCAEMPQLRKPEWLTHTGSLQGPTVWHLCPSPTPASEEVLNHQSPSLPSANLAFRQAPLAPAGSASRLPSSSLQFRVPAAPQAATEREQSRDPKSGFLLP